MQQNIVWEQGHVLSSTTGLNMAWEATGPANAPTVLLVCGFACQLTMWDDDFCRPLLEKGFRLVRFDNRDMGLTDEHPAKLRMNIPLAFLRKKLGLFTPANYKLDLLADDALGLIDALKLNKPHLLGISMGGMIVQIMAARHPEKIGNLITLMSSTNHPRLPMPSINVMRKMFMTKPKSTSLNDVVAHAERLFGAIASPGYPTARTILRERAKNAYLRSFRPEGVLRQTHCVMATGSIENYTRLIKVPTCVIHGIDDPLLFRKDCKIDSRQPPAFDQRLGS